MVKAGPGRTGPGDAWLSGPYSPRLRDEPTQLVVIQNMNAPAERLLSTPRTAACSQPELKTVPSPGGQDKIDSLIARVCCGDEQAWKVLWQHLDLQLDSLIRRRSLLGRLSQNEDERRGVILAVMSKLRQDEFRRLRLYTDEKKRNDKLSLLAWLSVVTRNAAVDYVRSHPDYVPTGPRRDSGRPGGVASCLPLPSTSRGPAMRPPVTVLGTAGELLEYARRELPQSQRRALELWLAGHSNADIADALGVTDEDEAERTVRAAVERLRRKFRSTSGGRR
jgi:DNA-directed RNA polymerase specialized sigma24 family protein